MTKIEKNTNKNSIDEDEQIKRNEYVLNLVNFWINSADQKIGTAFGIFSAIFAAFSFLVGSKLSGLRDNSCNCWYYVLLVLAIISIGLFLIGLYFFFVALKPSFNGSGKDKQYSIFYEEIAAFSKARNYTEGSKNVTSEQYNEELTSEIFYNSLICSKKMHNFSKGLVFSAIAILLSVSIIVALLII